jgi:hypothetical protein
VSRHSRWNDQRWLPSRACREILPVDPTMTRTLQVKEILIPAALSVLLGAALGMLSLLNLSAFYELDSRGQVKWFLIALLLFGIAGFFFTRWFLLPYYRDYRDHSNLLLIGFLSAILLALLVFSSPYFWTVPQIQQVSICYEASSPSEHLDVFEAHDTESGREYSPQSLGSLVYPIEIAANACIEGTEMALTALSLKDYGHGFGITVSQKDSLQRATLRLNNATRTYSLEDRDGILQTESLSVEPNAPKQDTFVVEPWGRKWMMVARWASIIFGSAYLALILFGISGRIVGGSDQ